MIPTVVSETMPLLKVPSLDTSFCPESTRDLRGAMQSCNYQLKFHAFVPTMGQTRVEQRVVPVS